MKRRQPAHPAVDPLPPRLAVFTPDDWPDPPAYWDLGVRLYQRLTWQQARTVWRRDQRAASREGLVAERGASARSHR